MSLLKEQIKNIMFQFKDISFEFKNKSASFCIYETVGDGIFTILFFISFAHFSANSYCSDSLYISNSRNSGKNLQWNHI